MYKSLFLLLCSVLVMSSCRYRHGKRVTGNGKEATAQRNLTGFTGVETHGDIDVVVSQGDFNVKVAAEENLLQYIETRVENGRLIVDFRDGISLMDHHDAKVYVTAPELNAFETHGSGNISSEGKIADKNKIGIDISGSGDVELTLDCPEINTSTDGSGDITLKGETKNVTCKTSGSGDLMAADLKAENVKVSVHGSGDAEVFASESLEVEISGSGDVHYKGAPRISTTVHGSGSVSKMD
jgi:hypothetical protein